eukprot:3554497-Ditylum_brightwellii.AAC.1
MVQGSMPPAAVLHVIQTPALLGSFPGFGIKRVAPAVVNNTKGVILVGLGVSVGVAISVISLTQLAVDNVDNDNDNNDNDA